MLFNSLLFIFAFMPAVLLLSLRLRGQALLRCISLSSFVFYAFAGHVWFLLPMLFTTLLDFALAPLMARQTGRRRTLILLLSLAGNLGLLFYFKYAHLMLDTSLWLVGRFGESKDPAWTDFFRVVLPAGISFYTFQTLSYMIDVYRGQAPPETNVWKFVSFVTFFPHLVAGPLTRHDQLIPQLDRVAKTGITPRWSEGVLLFGVGLAKKVLIADQIARVVDPWIDAPGTMSVATAWLALLGYTMQIYFDFSGYSDMAIGLGRLFGIELPQNFDSPYKARDPSDFWRRWHMTLSAWLRDYLYVSLGGNRKGPVRRYVNLMATMVLGGLWHGASWTFAVWGLYHGALLVIYHATRTLWDRLPSPFARALTFFLVVLGWLPFRARSFEHAGAWFAHLWSSQLTWAESLAATSTARRELAFVSLWLVVALAISHLAPNASSSKAFQSPQRGLQLALGVLAAVAVVFMNYSSRFLYFQF